MADPLGVSFSPTGQPGPGGQPQQPTPVQQAIQTLSLRVPPHAGASAFSAQPLLDSPGGSALGGNPDTANMLEMIKRLLFGQQPGQMGTPGAPVGPSLGGSAPSGAVSPPLTPHFAPGQTVAPAPGMPPGGGGAGAPPPVTTQPVPVGPAQPPPVEAPPPDAGPLSGGGPSETSMTPPSFFRDPGRGFNRM